MDSPISAPRPKAATHSGFTLIELLVVIAIIAILAAILFPVFAQAREKGRQTACLSNMKQMGTAMLMYTQDFDEAMINHYYGDYDSDITYAPGSTKVLYQWMDAVQPYTKNAAIFNCPSQGDEYLTTKEGNTPGFGYACMTDEEKCQWGAYVPYDRVPINVENRKHGSYCMNDAYWYGDAAGYPGSEKDNPPVASGDALGMAAIEAPASTIWVGESVGPSTITGYPIGADWGMYMSAAPPEKWRGKTKLGNFVARHSDIMNALYCDGHVKGINLNWLYSKVNTATVAGTTSENEAGASIPGKCRVLSPLTIEADPD